MTASYHDAVALRVLDAMGNSGTLGRGCTPVMILVHAPEFAHARPRDAGLFHAAVLLDTAILSDTKEALTELQIEVAVEDDLASVADRMRHFGIQLRDDRQTLSFHDP